MLFKYWLWYFFDFMKPLISIMFGSKYHLCNGSYEIKLFRSF
jgi:hypothetical protein